MNDKPQPTIFLSAAEVSGDKHASRLVSTLKKQVPQCNFDGLGGPAMAANGCNLLENLVARSAMLTHAVGQIGFYRKLLKRVKKHFATNRPDLVILVDSPAWNFHVAKAAKKAGIPTLYYIAPQLWAWGSWRAKKLRRCADQVACILPFEQQWFADHDIKAKYVGHPLFDDFSTIPENSSIENKSDLFPTVALLPGSRKHEIEHLWQPMLQIAVEIIKEYPGVRFLTAASDAEYAELLRENADPALGIEIRQTSIEAVTRYADLALVASGTATLEIAAQNCPMIVMYHVKQWQWHLVGKWLLKTKFISLVNILAQKELVPEFVPLGHRTLAVADKALELLEDDQKRQSMRNDLEALMAPIVQPGATEKVAKMAMNMSGL